MHLAHLEAEDFRNLTHLRLAFPAGPVVLLGENSQGKTNLLEAIFFACTGRLWRAAKDEEVICWDKQITRVKAEIQRPGADPLQTEIALSRTGETLCRVNEVNRRRSELLGLIPLAAFSSEDLQIIKGDPFRRRLFLNHELGQLNRSYHWNLLHYSRSLEQRNRLLKEIRERSGPREPLLPWEQALARYGGKIVEKRAQFLQQLEKAAAQHLLRLHPGWADLRLVYRPALKTAVLEKTPEEIENLLLQGFASCREEEIARGYSLIGPHRDDFDLFVGETDQRIFGSQGQQRSITIALRLALAEMLESTLGQQPLLLLDDVFSELDEGRRLGLLDALGRQQQFFITAPALQEVPATLLQKAFIYLVQAGQVSGVRDQVSGTNSQTLNS